MFVLRPTGEMFTGNTENLSIDCKSNFGSLAEYFSLHSIVPKIHCEHIAALSFINK